ncbi:tetraacyldisaccharide 4'-kinase [Methylocystis sp. JAN1]|uniref:tetraacyldisaccharide 4'-kinase n=1 Tax=Methylocystis sp. JAN1 TaxID=3397211 RepID=UPI003FA27DE5
MRAPEFWRADGILPRLLSPLGAAYGAVATKRLLRRPPCAALPTVVIGGLTAGGDGKTPTAIALAGMLAANGEKPALLTRGHGRPLGARPEPFAVDLAKHDSDATGDEALLLARHALTIVGADRAESGRLARALGATVLVLDDGFHSRRLAADLSLLVIDAAYGAGAGRCIPAGPLRAPLAAQLAAADALVVIGDGAAGRDLARRRAKPVFNASIVPDEATAGRLQGARVVAFAGTGRPEKFFDTLKEAGADIVATRRFSDHHRFSEAEISCLAALQQRFCARLVTTEKDAVRLRGSALSFDVLPIGLAFENSDALSAAMAEALERGRLRAS